MKNKLEWCISKAKRELQEGTNHRGVINISPDHKKAQAHVLKAEHCLKATVHLKEDFSDISSSTAFYAMYHCLLAILAKCGYESRNQECTFAAIHTLIEDNKIDFEQELLHKIAIFHANKTRDHTSIKIREQYQYGTTLSIKEDLYNELYNLAQEIIDKTKNILIENIS